LTLASILAAIALPACQDYTIRAKASKGVVIASGTKAAAGEHFANGVALLCSGVNAGATGMSTLAGDDATGTISMTIAHGVGGVADATFDLVPTQGAHGVTWDCNNPSDVKYVPAECRSQCFGQIRFDIPPPPCAGVFFCGDGRHRRLQLERWPAQ
jgi:type IV pilus assembly protein PilA